MPLTDTEIAYVGKKLKPIVFEDLICIAELEGEPVAFMMTLPDLNELLKPMKGKLLPFGWIKLLCGCASRRARDDARAADGRGQEAAGLAPGQPAGLHDDRVHPPRGRCATTAPTRGEIGWILEDNQGMVAIADAIDSKVNREYVIYEKAL